VTILIGADPELFVKSNGKFLSAEGLIPGTKNEPYKVPRGAVQLDGLAAEFNIDPTDRQTTFVSNLRTVRKELTKMIKTHDKSLEIVAEPVADFDPDYFKTLSDESKKLGCEPDYNAYEYGLPNPIPDNKKTFRTGSGHVHLGWTSGAPTSDKAYIGFCNQVVQELDIYLGLPSLLWDSDNRRRELYGKAGAYRPKHYGLEYRVLSNAWLKDDKLAKYVFQATRKCVANMQKGIRLSYYGLRAENTINYSDLSFRNTLAWSKALKHLPELPDGL
jgi:hypothetical protein